MKQNTLSAVRVVTLSILAGFIFTYSGEYSKSYYKESKSYESKINELTETINTIIQRIDAIQDQVDLMDNTDQLHYINLRIDSVKKSTQYNWYLIDKYRAGKIF